MAESRYHVAEPTEAHRAKAREICDHDHRAQDGIQSCRTCHGAHVDLMSPFGYGNPRHDALGWQQGQGCQLCDSISAALAEAEIRGTLSVRVHMFPIQAARKLPRPHPLRVPWSVAELAYSAYAARYGTQQGLGEIAARGGFGAEEMDGLLPDWRERCERLEAEALKECGRREERRACWQIADDNGGESGCGCADDIAARGPIEP